MKSLLAYAPLLALGPVTGPLVGMAIACARRGQWVRVGACVVGIVAFYVIAPMVLAWELQAVVTLSR